MVTKNFRRLLSGLALGSMLLGVGVAEAAIRFHSGPSVDVNGARVCTSANVSGVGNENIDVFFTVQYSATTTCRNKGGNVAPGQPLVSDTATFQSAPIVPKNGRATIDKCSPIVNQAFIEENFDAPNPASVCPNGNWSVDPIDPSDVSLSSYTITVKQGSTTLYTCSSTTGTCQ